MDTVRAASDIPVSHHTAPGPGGSSQLLSPACRARDYCHPTTIERTCIRSCATRRKRGQKFGNMQGAAMLPAASGQGTSRSVAGRVNPALGAVTEGLLELLWDHQGGRVPEDALRRPEEDRRAARHVQCLPHADQPGPDGAVPCVGAGGGDRRRPVGGKQTEPRCAYSATSPSPKPPSR
jgi:hypothetical protein